MLFHTPRLKNGITWYKVGANFSANASDANALDKNPANVIPIWIVAKNLLGDFNIFSIWIAFLFPSLACFSIFASFKDINAISLAAKNAFKKINITKITSCDNIFFIYSFFYIRLLYTLYLFFIFFSIIFHF